MLTKFLPLPDDGGGKKRSLAILRRLASMGEVVLCAFDDGRADVAALRAMGVEVRTVAWQPTVARSAEGTVRHRSITAGRFWDRRMVDHVRQAVADGPIDVLEIEYSQLTPYGHGIPAGIRVVDLHNVESALTASYAATRGPVRGLPYALEARALRRLERRALADFDVTVVVSDSDRRILPGPSEAAVVCPNGWDAGQPLPPAKDEVAIFVGQLGWPPNADAATWFGREIWPGVIRQRPGARLLLVGRDPTPAVVALGSATVEVTGSVPQVAPYLARARVALAPLRAGGGSRLKILEALDAGRPVVATPKGVEGLEDLVGEGVVVAEEPRELADTVSRLLADAEGAAELGLRGHRAVRQRYAWDVTLAPLIDRLGGL